MTEMSSSQLNDSSAYRALTLEMATDILACADSPFAFGEAICHQIRELTGARSVALFQAFKTSTATELKLFHFNPSRKSELVEHAGYLSLIKNSIDQTGSVLWTQQKDSKPEQLANVNLENFVALKMQIQSELTGLVVVNNLVIDDKIDYVIECLENLMPCLSLVFKSALDFQNLEQIVAERTRELAEKSDHLQITLDSIGDAVISTNTEGIVVQLNPVAENLTGWKADQARGMPLKDVFRIHNASTGEPADDPVEKVLLTGKIVGLANHTVLTSRNSVQFQIADSAAPIRGNDGKVVGVVLVFRDVTAEYAIQTKLQENEKKYRTLFEGAGEGITMFRNGVFVECNSHFLKQFGVSDKSQVLGKSPLDFSPPKQPDGMDSATKARDVLEKASASESSYVFEWRHRRPDGQEFDAEIMLTKLDLSDEPMFLGSTRDISESKRLRAALEKRLLALTQPLDDSSELVITDLISLEDLQQLQDRFADATGVASIITTPDGVPITAPSNFCRLCLDIIRKTDKGLANCQHSDACLGRENPDGPIIQPCLSGGLWDAGASINVGGRHLANWLIGQVKNEGTDEAKLLEYAREIGADAEEFRAALSEVTVMSASQFRKVADALFSIASELSSKAYQNVQQARFIEDRSRAAEKLKQSEEYNRLLVEHLPIGFSLCKMDGTIIQANQAYAETIGRTVDEVIGRKFSDFTPSDYTATDLEQIDLLKETGGFGAYEKEYLHRDGRRVPVRLSGRLITRGDEQLIWSSVEDITEQKRYENALRDIVSEGAAQLGVKFFETMVTQLCTILDADYTFIGEFADFRHEQIRTRCLCHQGKIIPNITFELDGAPCAEVIGKQLRSYRENLANLFPRDLRLIKMGIEAYVGVPLFDVQGKPNGLVVALFEKPVQNVLFSESILQIFASRIGAELERNALEQKLRISEKMEAIGKLAGGVAHDFNNMLNAIMASSQLLENSLPAHMEAEKGYAQLIQKATDRASALTSKLLAFSRAGTNESMPLDANDLIRNVIEILKHTLDKRIILKTDLATDQLKICGDHSQLVNALLNIAINARDAMPAGGELSFGSSTIQLDDSFCRQQSEELIPGTYTEISIADTGDGIPAEILNHIFEPFFTTKEVGKGTGLGLSAVYGIVRTHKGAITCSSDVGNGTIFKVYLPVMKGEGEVQEITPGTDHIVPGRGCVLLVDDEEIIRTLCSTTLKQLGYEVLTAANGSDAIKVYTEKHDAIDVVLLDLVMPEVNGPETFESIRSRDPNAKVIIMSGFSLNTAGAQELLDAGACAFIPKPFRVEQLSQILHQVVNETGPKVQN